MLLHVLFNYLKVYQCTLWVNAFLDIFLSHGMYFYRWSTSSFCTTLTERSVISQKLFWFHLFCLKYRWIYRKHKQMLLVIKYGLNNLKPILSMVEIVILLTHYWIFCSVKSSHSSTVRKDTLWHLHDEANSLLIAHSVLFQVNHFWTNFKCLVVIIIRFLNKCIAGNVISLIKL